MDADSNTGLAWGQFRFSVIGHLLASPPKRGELRPSIEALAAKTWRHPITGEKVEFAAVTIGRWYYVALKERFDPVGALARATRKDAGTFRISEEVAAKIFELYEKNEGWSYKLYYDNLKAASEMDPSLGPLPSYSTVRRYMRAHGLFRKRVKRSKNRPGQQRAEARLESRETRSFEVEHVGALWHLDFHHFALRVLTPQGEWVRPIALGILDDHSRLACHLQWYLSETAEDLVHGLCQAFQKRGLPRALLTDNGAAMVAAEVTQGLSRLGIVHETTLEYSPHQNGKQEAFWGPLEGRLGKMLQNVPDLRLEFLNEATQAWVEFEYNRTGLDETGPSPAERFARGPEVLRQSPRSQDLRLVFRIRSARKQRRSDGTITIEGVRFEIPSRFRHLETITVEYARWDLGRVHLVDPRTGALLSPLFPLDRVRNADGKRRVHEEAVRPVDLARRPDEETLPPLLRKLLREQSRTGLPPGYLPRRHHDQRGGEA